MIKNAGLVLKYMFPQATFLDIQVVDDGSGPRLAVFDEKKFGPRPSDAEIAAKEAEAVALFQNKQSQYNDDQIALEALKAKPRSEWLAADVKRAVQIWISRQ